MLAVSESRPVGVDIEEWRDALVTTAHKWLTPPQLACIHTPLDYLKAWTAKEAIYKLLPVQPPGLIDIPLPHLGEESPYEVSWEGDEECLLAIAIPKQ